MSKTDLETKLKELNIFDKKENDLFVDYVYSKQKAALNFQEFSEFIKPNMGKTDKLGNQLIIPNLTPTRENFQALASKMPEIKNKIKEFQRPFLTTSKFLK